MYEHVFPFLGCGKSWSAGWRIGTKNFEDWARSVHSRDHCQRIRTLSLQRALVLSFLGSRNSIFKERDAWNGPPPNTKKLN